MCQLHMPEITLHAADYLADGFTVEQYMADQTIACDHCAGVFDDAYNDGRVVDEVNDRWVCLPCLYERSMGR